MKPGVTIAVLMEFLDSFQKGPQRDLLDVGQVQMLTKKKESCCLQTEEMMRNLHSGMSG